MYVNVQVFQSHTIAHNSSCVKNEPMFQSHSLKISVLAQKMELIFLVILVGFYLFFISMWLKVLAAHSPLQCRLKEVENQWQLQQRLWRKSNCIDRSLSSVKSSLSNNQGSDMPLAVWQEFNGSIHSPLNDRE